MYRTPPDRHSVSQSSSWYPAPCRPHGSSQFGVQLEHKSAGFEKRPGDAAGRITEPEDGAA